jgi:hypothetical protein
MGGCRIPTRAAVSWLIDDYSFEYWSGRVTAYGMRRLSDRLREKAVF